MTETTVATVAFEKGQRVRYLPTRQTGEVVKVYDVADGVSLLVNMGTGDYLRMPVEDWEVVNG